MGYAINPTYDGVEKTRARPIKPTPNVKDADARAATDAKRVNYPPKASPNPAGAPGEIIDKRA